MQQYLRTSLPFKKPDDMAVELELHPTTMRKIIGRERRRREYQTEAI